MAGADLSAGTTDELDVDGAGNVLSERPPLSAICIRQWAACHSIEITVDLAEAGLFL